MCEKNAVVENQTEEEMMQEEKKATPMNIPEDAHARYELGCAYLYGEGVEVDETKALICFKLADGAGSEDAAIMLGEVYNSEGWEMYDRNRAAFYYDRAAQRLLGKFWRSRLTDTPHPELMKHPMFCYVMGRELDEEGYFHTDTMASFLLLKYAKFGFEMELDNGCSRNEDAYKDVCVRLADVQYDAIREEGEKLFEQYTACDE